MMDTFLVADMQVGLERDREPWLLPDQAFPTLEDAYLFRGRIQRRRGFANLGRLCEEATAQVLAVRGAAPQNLTGPLTIPGAALQIQPGSVTITDTVTVFEDDGAGNMVVTAGTGTGGSIDYFTGVIDVTFTGAVPAGPPNVTATFCLLYGRPVMGLRTRELTTINQEQLIGFDTDKANRFSTTNDRFEDITFYHTSGTAFSWTGDNSDFFWTLNYYGAFFATNYVVGDQPTWNASAGTGDGIRWYDSNGWVNFMPSVTGAMGAGGTVYLQGALILVSYRNRMVALNTYEGQTGGVATTFRQRS